MKRTIALSTLAALLAPKRRHDAGVVDYLQGLGIVITEQDGEHQEQMPMDEPISGDTPAMAIPINPLQAAFDFPFFTLDGRQRLTPSQNQTTRTAEIFSPQDDRATKNRPNKPPLEPLAPLMLRIQRALKQPKTGVKPAIKPIIKRLAKQQPIEQLPLLPRAALPHQIVIYLDTSAATYAVASDGLALVKRLMTALRHSHCQCQVIVLPDGPQGQWYELGKSEPQQPPLMVPELSAGCLIITGLSPNSENRWSALLCALAARGITPCWLSLSRCSVPGVIIPWGKTTHDATAQRAPLALLSALLVTCRVIPGALLRQIIQRLGLAAHYETAFWQQPHVHYEQGADNGYISDCEAINQSNEPLASLNPEQLIELGELIKQHMGGIGQATLHEHCIHWHMLTQGLLPQGAKGDIQPSLQYFAMFENTIASNTLHSFQIAQYLHDTMQQYEGLLESADPQIKSTLAQSSACFYRRNRQYPIPPALAEQTQQLLSQGENDLVELQLCQQGDELIFQRNSADNSAAVRPLLATFAHIVNAPLLFGHKELLGPKSQLQAIAPEGLQRVHQTKPMLLQSTSEQLLLTPRRAKDFYWAKSLAITAAGVVAETDFIRVSWPQNTPGPIIKVLDHAPAWLHRYPPQLDEFGLFVNIDIFADKTTAFKLRYIPPGSFLMGSPKSEAKRRENETQHPVTLTQGFWLGETTVSQQLWQAVMNQNPSRFKSEKNEILPVERVTWDDCKRFCDQLNKRMPELNITLPTEAQWEYACRAGSQTPFATGQQLSTEQANYDGNYPYNGAKQGIYRGKTVAIDSFDPNTWGLYQMHGNVWEWCLDEGRRQYTVQAVTDPQEVAEAPERVLRGGGWMGSGQFCRSAYRGYYRRDLAYDFIGLRVTQVEPASERAAPADSIRSGARAGKGEASGDDDKILR